MPTKFTVTIEAVGVKGDGLTHADGKRVFVAQAAVGDVAEVEITHETAEGAHAQITKLITPSPARTTPPCPHFDVCGSCSLQHLNYGTYTDLKVRMALEPLQRRGIDKQLDGQFITPEHSRRRTTLEAKHQQGKLALGYHMRRSHTVVDIHECPILQPELEAHLPGLRTLLDEILPIGGTASIQLTHTDNGTDMLLMLPLQNLAAEKVVRLKTLAAAENLSRLSWQSTTSKPYKVVTLDVLSAPQQQFANVVVIPAANSFLQASTEAETFMTETLLKHLPKKAKQVADLFCGSGTFSFPLAGRAKVTAVESDNAALHSLREAAKTAALADRVKTEARNLFHEPLSTLELNTFDAVVFDPPRAGANAQCQQLAKSEVPFVFAISCNPQSFAKDAETLVNGGYKLDKLYMVDQFLWSTHVEVMAVFKR